MSAGISSAATPLHPNAVLPCGTPTARRRHLALAQVCETCELPDAPPAEYGRRSACPGCGTRVRVEHGRIAAHTTRVVSGTRVVSTSTPCPGVGAAVRPLDPVARALRARRIAKGLTQEQLAVRTGMSRSTLANYESGSSPLRAQSVAALAAALECDLVPTPRLPS